MPSTNNDKSSRQIPDAPAHLPGQLQVSPVSQGVWTNGLPPTHPHNHTEALHVENTGKTIPLLVFCSCLYFGKGTTQTKKVKNNSSFSAIFYLDCGEVTAKPSYASFPKVVFFFHSTTETGDASPASRLSLVHCLCFSITHPVALVFLPPSETLKVTGKARHWRRPALEPEAVVGIQNGPQEIEEQGGQSQRQGGKKHRGRLLSPNKLQD